MHSTKIIKTGLNLFAGLCLALQAGDAMAQRPLSDSTIAKLKLGVEGFQERYQSPSIVVAIVHGDTIIFSDARGFTDLENKIPATIDSKYQIQSITKMFTATMFMQLWEQRIIDGNDNVSAHVPEFAEDATFLELATHDSGLPRNSPADVGFARQVDRWLLTKADEGPIRSAEKEDFISSLTHVSRQYPAYEFLKQDARHYSNLGYGLLGLALERATGTDYEAYVVDHICIPMGLTNTGFGTVGTADNPIAKGYFYRGDSLAFIRTPNYLPGAMVPAAGMYSTARDLARFISAQFGGNHAALPAKTSRMMQQLGIGWLRNYPFVMHEGSMLGARAEVVFHPKLRIGWVVLANTTDFPFNRINDYIAGLIVPLYMAEPIIDLEKYAGIYALEGGYGKLEIYLKDDKLYSTYLQGMLPDEALRLSGEHSLTAKGMDGHDIHYEFITDAGKEITGLNLNQLLWIKQGNDGGDALVVPFNKVNQRKPNK